MSETDSFLESPEGSELIGPLIQRIEAAPTPPYQKLPTLDDLKDLGRGKQRLNQFGYYKASKIVRQNPQLATEIGLDPLEVEVAGDYYPRIVESDQPVEEILNDLERDYIGRGMHKRNISKLMTNFRRKISRIVIEAQIAEPSSTSTPPDNNKLGKHLAPLPAPPGQGEWIARQVSKIGHSLTAQQLRDTDWIIRNTERLKKYSLPEE